MLNNGRRAMELRGPVVRCPDNGRLRGCGAQPGLQVHLGLSAVAKLTQRLAQIIMLRRCDKCQAQDAVWWRK